MHTKIKSKSRECGRSVNAYIVDLLAADLQQTEAKNDARDEIEWELMNHIAAQGYPMSFRQAMTRFHLTYQQLYNRYKHLLIGDRQVEQAKARAKEFEEAASDNNSIDIFEEKPKPTET